MHKFQKHTIYEALGRQPVHPFPARMAPGIALDALSSNPKPLRVLDPMMGSGTVLAMARSLGHRAVGFDLDPLAVVISKAWTTAFDIEDVHECAEEVLQTARLVFAKMADRDAYPEYANEETKNFIRYWFDGYARRQLNALSRVIGEIESESMRTILWCVFSRLIISKQSGASLAMDLSHSRPHRVFEYAPAKPFHFFIPTVERVLLNVINQQSKQRGPAPVIGLGDARNLPLKGGSINLVLTSPPYLNAIDYIRCSKFSLVWMGYNTSQLRQLRSASIGSESGIINADEHIKDIIDSLKLRPQLAPKNVRVLGSYILDMRFAINEVSRVLSRGGKAVYVVGENSVKGSFIRTSAIIQRLAEDSGLSLEARRTRGLPPNRRYMPPPSATSASGSMDKRMRQEVVLTFSK